MVPFLNILGPLLNWAQCKPSTDCIGYFSSYHLSTALNFRRSPPRRRSRSRSRSKSGGRKARSISRWQFLYQNKTLANILYSEKTNFSTRMKLLLIFCPGLARLAKGRGLDQGFAPGVAQRARLAHLQGGCALKSRAKYQNNTLHVFNFTGGLAA